ncbi:MAG: lipoate--protein ligase family protein [Candidatus Melainabacteria bacterium]|jgi:lipoate-protein ligase A|nr:lipoate--protein ligase family protein [Candidatus Melainabacteria bacterium]
MQETWRLIDFESFDAATNMAVDEAILDAHIAAEVPPTLRFYGWAPPAVSIGYGQKLPEKVCQKIAERGFDVVKRPTGGRAVLHLDELTYSFVGSANGQGKVLGSSVIESYKKICQALIAGFKTLGVTVEIGQGQAASRQMLDCFTATTTADLHYQGKKIVGSAQLRRHDALLQHGSILLCQEQNLMGELLLLKGKSDSAALEEDNQRHANLFEITGIAVSALELIPAFKAGFETTFGIALESDQLTPGEWRRVDEIKEKAGLLIR